MTVETAPAPRHRKPFLIVAAAVLVVVLAAVGGFLALKAPADRAAREYARDAAAHVDRVLALVDAPRDAIAEIDAGRVPAPEASTGAALSGDHRTVDDLVARYDDALDALRVVMEDAAAVQAEAEAAAQVTTAQSGAELLRSIAASLVEKPEDTSLAVAMYEWDVVAKQMVRVADSVAVIEDAATRLEQDQRFAPYPSTPAFAARLREWAALRAQWVQTMSAGVVGLSEWSEDALGEVEQDLDAALTGQSVDAPEVAPFTYGLDLLDALFPLERALAGAADEVTTAATAFTAEVEADPAATSPGEVGEVELPDSSQQTGALAEVRDALAAVSA